MSISDDIKRELEDAIQLPFTVSRKKNTSFPTWEVIPKYGNNIYGLFQVEIEAKKYRINIRVTPERLSREMMEAISDSSITCRNDAARYFTSLETLGGRTVLTINDQNYSAGDFSSWPVHWDSFSISYTRMPIHERDDWARPSDFSEDLESIVRSMLSLIMDRDHELLPLEGTERLRTSREYERNPIYRRLCIAKYGYRCQICGFDFEKVYGELGKHYIQVHHILPVSEYSHAQTINPETDLIPVCPNCHAMLHRKKTVLLPAELQDILKQQK